MRNHAFLKVVLLGLLTFALAPGVAGAASQGILASNAAERASAASDPTIAVAPPSVNFGIVNAGSTGGPVHVIITNTGGGDLEISAVTAPAPFSVSPAVPPSVTVTAGGFLDVSVEFMPTDGASYAANMTIMSNAVNAPILTVPLAGRGNTAPMLVRTPSDASFSLAAFQSLHLDFTATDPEGDNPLAWSIMNQPFGSSFVGGTTDEFGVSMATFDWATDLTSVGNHTGIAVRATDPNGMYSESFFDIFVTFENSPPTADAGGPYNGVRTVPVQFDGSGSTDPDGNGLSYSWSFGDGSFGTGAMPSHPYSSTGTFIVNLTVTDDQAPAGVPPLSNTATTVADIIDFIPVQVTAKLQGGAINAHSPGGRQAMGMETIPATNVDPSDIDPSSVQLSALGNPPISADLKGSQVGADLDGDGLAELLVYFSRGDLATLLSGAANNSMVTFTMTAVTFGSGAPVRGTGTFRVKTGGGQAVTSAAAPNPFNPETSISYSLRNEGPVSVKIYSVNGRLVRTLREEYGTPGTHEVRWNGMDDRGNQVRSGIYFVNVVQGENRSQTKVVVAK